MSASKYLPPFTAEERVAITGDRVPHAAADQGAVTGETEVTYADFLVDEIDE